jgi:hypothetical protein
MNERFNELRLDAGIARVHDEPYLVVINKSGEIIDPIIGLEKFAELIVLECCDLFVDTDLTVRDVKKHFGVEESQWFDEDPPC